MLKSLISEKFSNPDATLRGKPFWSWNGKLEKKELLRQIDVMKDMGFGGYFMHSRSGLETEYMGDEWFDLINACADEGEKQGMEAWLYDEDRWPSGSAGGLATKEPQYRMKYMRCRVHHNDSYVWNDSDVAVFSCKLDGLSFTDCRRINSSTELATAKRLTILTFTTEEMECDSFYNGETYLDTMNADAVNHFINLTHEKYKQHCGDKFGKSIKGMFTDEPHRGMIMSNFYPGSDSQWLVPYTPTLFQEFQTAFGYDLVENLPELFLWNNGRKVSQVKWHYVEIIQQLFLNNFAKLTHDWCKDNNLLLTGHILHEDTLTAQTIPSGSVMRYYEYMDYPGIDLLTETNRNYWIVKQLTSAARQLGKEWLLSELYGCSGWQMSLQNYKETGDWQSFFGINLRCPHLSWYTMKGQAKRDYPGSILHQSGWYKEFETLESYFSRLQLMLMQGEQKCEVLVINPIESVWAQIYPGWSEGFANKDDDMLKLEEDHADLFMWLAGAGIDFDYGDEDMLNRLSSVDNSASKPIFKVGKADYSTVVVPPLTIIRSTTLKLLKEFVAAGGKVIFAGELPQYVDAVESKDAILLAENCDQCDFNKVALTSQIKSNLDNLVEINTTSECNDIFCQVRQKDDDLIVVAMNVSTTESYDDTTIKIKAQGCPQIWDCRTGEIFATDFIRDGEFVEVCMDFDPARELVIVVSPAVTEQPNTDNDDELCCMEISEKTLTGPFDYTLTEPNICVLDTAKFKIAQGDWQDEKEILKIDRQLRLHMGLEKRSGQMVQPWCRTADGNTEQISLEFSFNVQVMPQSELVLAIEEPEKFDIYVNDSKLDKQLLPDFWLDICFSKLVLPTSLLVGGENKIRIETLYNNDHNLESLYLLGDFGVEVEGRSKSLTALPEQLTIGDITPQGLAFYSGKLQYHIDSSITEQFNSDSSISLPDMAAACGKVVDGKGNEKLLAFKPYSTTLDSLDIQSGLSIELVFGRRNTFGPLHLDRPDIVDGLGFRKWYGPAEFETTGELWCDNYNLLQQGLLKAPIIYG